ncbi:hypothetical protein TomTYG75_07040 [Sphingobium sp. TomTYG75]
MHTQHNKGRNPYEGNDSPPLIDVKYRSGVIARCVRPDQRRWKPWPTGPDAWDIISFQLSTGKDYELIFPA